MQPHTEQDMRNLYNHLLPSLEKAVSPEARSKIDTLVREFASFKDTEKILCVLLLPTEPNGACAPTLIEDDIGPNGFEINTLGVGIFGASGCPSSLHLSNQVEQSQAFTWIMSHLEEDSSTCLRKDEVYDDYRAYCEKHSQKTLNTADFGKVMKRAFPNVRPRRLGQRGQSRYCYGGMRKKLEVQAPSLPDLTMELSSAPASNFRSSSSSVSSADEQRLSQRGDLLPTWLTDDVRAALGVTGTILADVARIILEYVRTVLGTDFTSLFQLAQHLVANRYVTTHSRHAFTLIAHLANSSTNPPTIAASPSLSNILLTPSAAAAGAFAEALQKGMYGQMCRQSLESYSNLSENSALKQVSDQLSPIVPKKDGFLKKDVNEPNLSSNADMGSVRSIHSPAGRVNSAGSTASSSHSRTPPVTTAMVNPIGGTGGGTHPYRSPAVTVASAIPAVAYQLSPSSHYPFPLSQFSTTSNSALQNLVTKPVVSAPQATDAYLSTPPYLNHRHQPYAHSSTDQRRTSFSENPASYLTPVTCATSYCASTPATPYPTRSLEAHGSYPSYGTGGAFVPQALQPPAPLPPPIASGRSPYAAVPYKHSATQLPMDAPGAHEPTARVHLGGSSPTKQMNFFSLGSGSQGTGSYEAPYQQRAAVSPAPPPPPSAPSAVIQPSTSYYPTRYSNFSAMSPATPGPPSPNLPTTPLSPEAVSAQSSWRPIKRSKVARATSSFDPETVNEDPFDYDNLPHLGSSPCPPEIPPSSPTEFLSFYSAGNAARRKETHDTSDDLDRTLTNLSPDTSGNAPDRNKPDQPLHVHIDQDENEAEVVRKREALHDALLTPSGESASATTSPPITPRERYGQPHSGGSVSGPPAPSTPANLPCQRRPTPSSSSESNVGGL